MKLESVLIKPLVTEKNTTQNQINKYIFEVHPKATKVEIAQAVEALLKVKVDKVNVTPIKPKFKRFKGIAGTTSSRKKAYVTLTAGESIELFTGV